MSLENEFKEAVDTYEVLIKAKLAQANKLVNEAISIAEEHGIPFYSSVSQLGQQYTPVSFRKKWGELDSETLEELDIYVGEYDEGWAHSAVC